MDTKKLRQKILDLAIRGKLVPQDPNDEPASVLLERIRAEKERLIAEGKIKRPKKSKASSAPSHYQNFTPPFDIPDSWEWCTLSDCCHIAGRIGFRGYTKDDLVGEHNGAITLSPSNIVNDSMQYDICTYISWDKYHESPEIQVQNNDILLVKTGSSFGKCALVKDLPQEATINPQYVVLKHIMISPEYLTILLQSPYARKCYERFVIGTAIPTFTQEKLGNLAVPVPPYREQLRITQELHEIQCGIKSIILNEQELDSCIKQAKSKILDLAMQGKLVSQDPTDEPAADMLLRINPKAKIITDNPHLKNIPKEWCWVKLKDICIKIVDGDHNPPMGQTIDTGFYMISASNIVNDDITIRPSRYITEEQFNICNNRTNVAKGDVLLTTVGSIGRTAIFSLKSNITFQRSVSVISTLILNLYLKFFLDSPNTQKYMIENAKGTAQKGFYINQLCSLPIPIPSMKEQQRIVANIEELYSVLDEIESSLQS